MAYWPVLPLQQRRSQRARANCCKRLTKRRLFARGPSGPLEQSTLEGRHAARSSVCKIGKRRAAVCVAVFSRFAIYANVVRRMEAPERLLRLFQRQEQMHRTGTTRCSTRDQHSSDHSHEACGVLRWFGREG